MKKVKIERKRDRVSLIKYIMQVLGCSMNISNVAPPYT